MERNIQNVPAGPEQIAQLQNNKPKIREDKFFSLRVFLIMALSMAAAFETKSLSIAIVFIIYVIMFEIILDKLRDTPSL